MMGIDAPTFSAVWQGLGELILMAANRVDVGEWQSLDVSDKEHMVSHEVAFVSLSIAIPETIYDMQLQVEPNLPWAEDHFLERVSGMPLNPPPSAAWWPYAQKNNAEHKKDEKFSHTYPERFWPKHAGHEGSYLPEISGIRYRYGDLNDVVDQLVDSPLTRQAYLPVWFPEDTGAVHGERVPCTLGYNFLIRENRLSVVYFIRSCDFLRHFRDDAYMAMRLAHWVAKELKDRDYGQFESLDLGKLIMHITSLHVFEGDLPKMRKEFS